MNYVNSPNWGGYPPPPQCLAPPTSESWCPKISLAREGVQFAQFALPPVPPPGGGPFCNRSYGNWVGALYTGGGCIRLPAAHLIEQGFEVGEGSGDSRNGSRPGPLGQARQLQQGGAFARGFQFDFEGYARPHAVNVGVSGGAEDGA